MKKILLFSLLCIALMSNAFAQTPLPLVTIQDSISTNTHWTGDKQYLVKGWVYVTSGATLTIDSGVIVFGDKNTKGTIIVERGAKLFANGTPCHPVIFTSHEAKGSRSAGDWGGVMICGYAPTNHTAGEGTVEGGPRSKYGGTDAHDNSGSLTYCRIEFGGIAFSVDNEVNGLTLCGVGDATTINHIQVSYSGDDSYEWFGGSVNAKYLISFGAWDDDFDTDYGYNGKNQFLISLRDPYSADQSGSKAFESDSYHADTYDGKVFDSNKITKCIFSNVTAIGPMVTPTSTAYSATQYVAGAHIRRGSSMNLVNSILAGYPCGILIDDPASASFGSTVNNITQGFLQVRNTIVCGIPTNLTPNPKELVYVYNGAGSLTNTSANGDTTTGNPFNPFAGPFSWFKDPNNSNKIYADEQNGVRLQNPFSLTNPNFTGTSSSPVIYRAKLGTNGHVFDACAAINTDTTNSYQNYNVPLFWPDYSGKLSDPFFDKVNYVGAISGCTNTPNWALTSSCWTNWDPNNTDYTQWVVGVSVVAESFETARLFPNPASNSAYVSFNLKIAAHVKVAITDITGKVISEVYSGQMQKGSQMLTINLNNLNTGMYFVSIMSENKNKTLKLNVIK